MWLFGFDGQHRPLTESIQKGTGFEPWIWHWQPNTTATEAGGGDKELFRMIEHLHTDWSGSFFNFTLQRWLYAKLDMVMHGDTRSAARARHFSDHQQFDPPVVRQTSALKAVSVDVTVVNTRSSGTLAVYKSTQPNDAIAVLEPGSFIRFVSYEGERLVAQAIVAGGKLAREEWSVSFANGVVQERHVTQESCSVE